MASAAPASRRAAARRNTRGMTATKRRTHAGLALNGNVAAQELGQFSSEGQPQPDTLGPFLQRAFDLTIFLEDSVEILGRDADPGILDREDDDVVRLLAGRSPESPRVR